MSNSIKARPRTGRQTGNRSSEKPLWQTPFVWLAAAGALAVVGVAIAIALSVGGNDDDAVSSETAFAEIIGEPLPSYETPDPGVGLAAPVVAAQTLGGERIHLGDDGSARIFGFFAHWCPHCQAELPEISAWLGTNELPSNVEVVAVSTSVDPNRDNYPPSEWFPREQWPTTVLLDSDSNALATGFGLTSFPYWVVVDNENQVVARITGQVSAAQFAQLVESIR